jgi:hypothetical protein
MSDQHRAHPQALPWPALLLAAGALACTSITRIEPATAPIDPPRANAAAG